MTLDVLQFIDNKGGSSEEIRDSQRKRGHSIEVVDEVIQMYADWVKCTLSSLLRNVVLEMILMYSRTGYQWTLRRTA